MQKLIFKRSALAEAVRAMITDAAGRDDGRGFIELYATVTPETGPAAEVVEFWTREVSGTGALADLPNLSDATVYIGRELWFDLSEAEGYGPEEFNDYVSDNLRDWTAAKLDQIIDFLEFDGYTLEIVED